MIAYNATQREALKIVGVWLVFVRPGSPRLGCDSCSESLRVNSFGVGGKSHQRVGPPSDSSDPLGTPRFRPFFGDLAQDRIPLRNALSHDRRAGSYANPFLIRAILHSVIPRIWNFTITKYCVNWRYILFIPFIASNKYRNDEELEF